MKKCNRCLVDTDDFYKNDKTCRKCRLAYQKNYFQQNKEKKRKSVRDNLNSIITLESGRSYTKRKKKKLKEKYQLTLSEYDDLLENQGFRCKICDKAIFDVVGEKATAYVDHCHHLGSVRGILCNNCNTGLGHFRDDPKLLQKAIEYVNHD